MRRDILINASVALLLLMLVGLTLSPLALMVYTSLKPMGTLTKDIRQISLECPPQITESATVRVSQDMRKFSALVLWVRGQTGTEEFDITLCDINGNACALDSGTYMPPPPSGRSGEWRKVVIPTGDFNITALNPYRPEKIAEFMIIRTRGGSLFIKDARLVVKRITVANYADVLISGSFGRYFFNSTLIALMITIGNIIFCTLVGYAFARKDFPLKRLLFFLILASIMIPPQVLIVPIFIMMKNIRWLNTYWALIIPNLVQPFGIFLMKQYISRLPVSLEDQARVDGATEMQILLRIIFPLSRPALAIVGINTFMGAWNTFLFPFILTNTPGMRTLPVGLALFRDIQGADWVHLMAASSITALPVIIVFLGFQKHIIAGLTTGLVKR